MSKHHLLTATFYLITRCAFIKMKSVKVDFKLLTKDEQLKTNAKPII